MDEKKFSRVEAEKVGRKEGRDRRARVKGGKGSRAEAEKVRRKEGRGANDDGRRTRDDG